MKELHRKGSAIHSDPESCFYSHKAIGEALTGESAGHPLSCEIQTSREPTLLSEAEGNTLIGDKSEVEQSLGAVGEPEHARILFAREPGDPGSIKQEYND